MKITRKLVILVAVPLAAVVGFAALAVVTSGGAAARADGLRRLVTASASAGELVYRLQAERAAAGLALNGSSRSVDALLDLVAASDAVAAEFRGVRGDLPTLPEGLAATVARVEDQLGRLAGLRKQVIAGQGAASAVAFTYRIIIADLITFRESVAQAGGAPAEVADRLRAAAAVSRAAEAVGLQQVAVLRAAGYGSLSRAAAQEITAARTGRLEALQTFDSFATAEWRAAMEQAASGADALAAQELEDQVSRLAPGARLRVDAKAWVAATGGRMGRLRQVEARVDADIQVEVTALRDARRREAAAQVAAVLAVVGLVLALALWLGRPMVAGLRRLREAADRVANAELPAAVAELDRSESLGGLSPEEFAAQTRSPVPVAGRDELADVGRAFGSVYQTALRIAAEQAVQRRSVAAMFVNLARRGQKLHGRLTATLDDVERDEQDAARLAQLFTVDLLVTLLGRTNDSLLVLGDGGRAHVRTGDEPLAAVLQAAQGQVEGYTRIEFGVVDKGVAVRAAVVDEVVLLLAGLMDNAVQYSPPHTPVKVAARWLADRVVIQVTDVGLGIDPARRDVLNRRLAGRPALDAQAVEMMGLTVVGRIAARYGIRVELRAGQPAGTIAEVTLPAAVLATEAVAGTPAVPRPRTAVDASPAGPVTALEQPDAGSPGLPWPPLSAGTHDPMTVPVSVGEQTVELYALGLPIYEQVRSQWFASGSALDTDTDQAAPGATGWRTPADEGWRAAAAAAQPVPAGTTRSGLPKRRRGAQLVPGGVDHPAAPSLAQPVDDRRDPVSVGAAMTAYQRGLRSGRAGPTTATVQVSADR